MGTEIPVFPEASAWAATLPDVRASFAASKDRSKAIVSAPQNKADAEYGAFASLDLDYGR